MTTRALDLDNFQSVIILELRCEEGHGQFPRVVWWCLVVQDEVDCSRGTQGQEMALGITQSTCTHLVLFSELSVSLFKYYGHCESQATTKAASVLVPNT